MKYAMIILVAILALGIAMTADAAPSDQCGVKFPCPSKTTGPYTPTLVNVSGTAGAQAMAESRTTGIHVYIYVNGLAPSETGDYELQLSDDLPTAKAQAALWLKAHPGMALGGYFRPNRRLENPVP